jgi:hypothetical protein
MSALKNAILSDAQNVDEAPSYRLLEKKIIFPSIYCFLYHWTNTFDFSWGVKTTKAGKDLYKLNIALKPQHWNDMLHESFPTNIQCISVALEHHTVVQDEPNEYDTLGRLHFVTTPLNENALDTQRESNAKNVEDEKKMFAKLMNKLNAQLSSDFPAEEKRGEYFKDLCEYKINMSKYSKFKIADFIKRDGFVVVDIAFGWIIEKTEDTGATQGVTLNLNGYRFRPRDPTVDAAISTSQKRRRETLEKQKEEKKKLIVLTDSEVDDYIVYLKEMQDKAGGRKKLAPEITPETMPSPEIVAGRYEIIDERKSSHYYSCLIIS